MQNCNLNYYQQYVTRVSELFLKGLDSAYFRLLGSMMSLATT